MIQYKCAKCGAGELEPLDDGRKAMCPYCNSIMVLPTLDPDVFNRANDLRLRREFDRAQMAFERIVEDNPTDSESYWNLVLCRYGIEYVEDVNGIMLPTCHRMSYDSILDDGDYQNALKYADGYSHQLYQAEAAKIDAAMKRIINIAQTQKPYDVFISYKETDAEKHKTIDSNIAQDIYEALKEKHPELNVFLSRITLKNMDAGMDFEPIIFSALNTAKVMIVVGTSRENLESVWVRNEWSRYRKMMERDTDKKMVTVFRDMNPSRDFPKELRLLDIQATEARGAYLPDFIRGIEDLLGLRSRHIQFNNQYVYNQSNVGQIPNFLKRADQELQRGQFESAKNFLNMALDIDDNCIGAWWRIFKIETNLLRYIDNTRPFELSDSARKAWRKVADSGESEEKAAYTAEYNDYKNRWEKAFKDLELENNKAFVDSGIAKLIKETKNGVNFNEYSTYRRNGEFTEKLYRIATLEQKRALDEFQSVYERNYQRFKDLQELKRSDPDRIINEIPHYQKTVEGKERA